MASPPPALPPPRKAFALNSRSAVAWSLVLHAALIYLGTRISWMTPDVEEVRSPEVIWLRESPLGTQGAAATAARPEESSSPSPPRETDEAAEKAAATKPEEAPEAAPPEPAAGPASEAPNVPEKSAASSNERSPEPLRPEVDWEAERQRAARQVVAALDRNRFRTFSLADVIDEAPEEADDPLEHLFDESSAGRSGGRPVASVGSARTKVGRALLDLCNALTGGFSVMGFFSVCAEDNIGSYAASPLRPDYLKKLPVCTDTAVAADMPGIGQIPATATTAGDGAATTVKCRLLDEEERAAYWKAVAARQDRSMWETETAADAR